MQIYMTDLLADALRASVQGIDSYVRDLDIQLEEILQEKGANSVYNGCKYGRQDLIARRRIIEGLLNDYEDYKNGTR